uniref:GLI pathogenesis related 1 n=1 Tax=Lepisosteus oculatus TaxID=7918 RepID=W5NHE5_LEPOC|nr:PREDICTED: glioma pathogenesis-related protein 1 [Lepisosteus oculatus]
MAKLSFNLLLFTIMMDSTVYLQSLREKPLPDINNQDFIKECVEAHNQFRSQVNPPASGMMYMTWDEALAKTARAWARTCNFNHNIYLKQPGKVHPTFTPVGENIWVGAPSSIFTVSKAVKAWYDEVKDYEYNDNVCRKACGHYTQVVWEKSYKVGCAVQVCPSGITDFFTSIPNPTIFVCNYGDAGNLIGVHPYTRGVSCSRCGSDTCVNHLCRNQAREQLKSYKDWYPDWDTDATSSASSNYFCITVLISRSVSLALIFAGVYGFQQLYPNMFAYE